MKSAFISTIFNERKHLAEWLQCICSFTRFTDELAICDGGSTDGSWELLNECRPQLEACYRSVTLIREPCNIARGRNLAILATRADIIASNDAGSLPDVRWLEEILKPLEESANIDVVGGQNAPVVDSKFKQFLLQTEKTPTDDVQCKDVLPSSRCIAFRRNAFDAIGGYPEWLTMTGEDALFNFNLVALGMKFHYAPGAIVRWSGREDRNAYFHMLFMYGFGAGEARLYTPYFLRRLLTTIFPPLILLSKHPLSLAAFRYQRNAASSLGWIKGLVWGKKVPCTWKRVDGVYLSPESQKCLASRTLS